MRYSVILAVAMAGLAITASAQKMQKTKPSHNSEKESKKGSHVAIKDAPNKSTATQELRRVEQSGSKVSGSRHETAKATRTTAVKGEKKEANPPIHFGSSGSGKGGKSKAGDPYKGRLRHKGSRH
jgi:hypothetical protein